jgi:hypothetical protein
MNCLQTMNYLQTMKSLRPMNFRQTMNFLQPLILISLAAAPCLPAAETLTGFPFQNETLRYNVNWPSGLSLGEAVVTASKSGAVWSFALNLTVSIPGFPLGDNYRSSAAAIGLCSTELNREVSHGGKKVTEKTTFDQKNGTAKRQTVSPAGGGSSDLSFHGCGQDALAFWFFARRELGQGRVPPPETIFFGSGYAARMEYIGAQTIPVAETQTMTDHLVAHVKGPASDFSLDIFYARDAARTPLLLKIPVTAGTISLELVR